ncbi:SsrA-binding protein, partial [Staphylococcus aureus]
VFFSDKGFVKVEIGLGRGKKLHDKRNTIKDRDVAREIKRHLG